MYKARGFTIVELLIVIVVIAILATISVATYSGIQSRAEFSRLKAELSSLNKAVEMYYIDHGSYPVRTSWSGNNQAINDAFIPGLAPHYIDRTPQVESHGAARPTFLYISDGSGYKLVYIADNGAAGDTGLPALHRQDNSMLDPARPTRAWGYWTENHRTR